MAKSEVICPNSNIFSTPKIINSIKENTKNIFKCEEKKNNFKHTQNNLSES